MKLIKVGIKNFLSLGNVEFTPSQITQIVGGNNNGKTSILRAIETALAGSTDATLVRHGEDMAEIILDFDDGLKVHRKIRSDGKQAVQVKNGDMKASKPQAMLDSILAGISFNPLELLDPKNRAEAILKSIRLVVSPEDLAQRLGIPQETLPPLNYQLHGLKVIDQAHQYFYQRRAEANRDVAAKQQRWQTYSSDLPVAPQPPKHSRAELLKKGEELLKEQGSLSMAIMNANTRADQKLSIQKEIDVFESNRQELIHEMDDIRRRITDLENRIAAETRRRDDIVLPDVEDLRKLYNETRTDLDAIKIGEKEIESFESHQKMVKMVDDIRREVEAAKVVSAGLDAHVAALAGRVKAELMEKVEMPVAGLEFKDGHFFVNGSSIDNLSSSAALRLAVGVARKLAQDTKIICIDGAELLDEETFAALRTEIEAAEDFTFFITKVGAPFKSTGEDDLILGMHKGQVNVTNESTFQGGVQ